MKTNVINHKVAPSSAVPLLVPWTSFFKTVYFQVPFRFLLLGLIFMSQTAMSRLFDRFDSSGNWTLSQNNGTAVIANSQLTLAAPANTIANPTATLSVSAQTLTGTRQSILVRSHTGVANKTVFFFWAMDTATGNMLEIKINDQATTTLTCGYYDGGGANYHYVGSMNYATGTNGIYLAFKESAGVTHWQMSTDNANTWTDITSLADPISTGSMIFLMQHKEYSLTSATSTTVDCFNYKANGDGYHNIEDKTYTGSDGWHLYCECFTNGHYMYQCNDGGCNQHIFVNDVISSQHFTDSTIPLPRYNDTGYHFEIISNDMLWWKNVHVPSLLSYDNAYRYQSLPYVDADTWTYHLYFKYAYSQTIQQGLEFPINKYTGSHRLQGALGWYPNRPDNGSHTGKWSVYNGSKWVSTGYSQTFSTNRWYEVTFTVGLHDNTVYYSNFQAGVASGMTNWVWNHSYTAPSSTTPAKISPAMQVDDNTSDTTLAGTRKDLYMAEWNIDWRDERLPATP